MIWLLDTNVCIRYLNGRSPSIRDRLRRKLPEDITLCSVVRAELWYGAYKSRNPAETIAKQKRFTEQFRSWPFDDEAAQIYGQIRADLAQKGTPIGPHDLQIAAIALARDCTLVTHNTGEFGRVSGLKFEDWEEAA